MGYYLQAPHYKNKAEFFIRNHKAIDVGTLHNLKTMLQGPTRSTHVPVVVIDNGQFEAAGIAFDMDELRAFTDPTDARPKTLLIVPREEVIKLCPMVESRLKW